MSIKCEYCPKKCKSERGLQIHIKKIHVPEWKIKDESPDKPKTKAEQKTIESPKPTLSLTSDEQAIAERVAKQDTDWFAIRGDELNDFSLMANPLDLQPEAKKMQDEHKYAFRWCERKTQRIDQLTRAAQPPLRWALCTRTTTPFLAQYVDDLLGCICTLDQVLLYKPWHHHELVKKAKAELADIQDGSGTLAGKKRQIEERDDDVEVMSGSQFSIKGSDVMMSTDAGIEKAAVAKGFEAEADDSTELGDLVVAE